jgi:hypothetical protein
MDALTTIYTTLETLQEEGKLTDGVYLAAMNALQVVYNSVPRPPPTATAVVAPATGEPPAWKTQWQSLFSSPWPVHFNSHCPDHIRTLLTAICQWAAIPPASRPIFEKVLTPPELWIAHGMPAPDPAHHYRPVECAMDYLTFWMIGGTHVWADGALEEALRNDTGVRDNRLARAIKQLGFWQKEFAHFADLAEFSPASGKMTRWLHERTSGLYGGLRRRRGRGWATEPTDTTRLHRVRITFPAIVDTTEWSAEFWTPRVQLGRTHLTRTMTVLRVIAAFLHGGEFQREMVWCSLTERSYGPHSGLLADWSTDRGMDLVVSGITGSTRQMRRTYVASRPDNLTGPWVTVTYQDPLNTGGPEEVVENATE